MKTKIFTAFILAFAVFFGASAAVHAQTVVQYYNLPSGYQPYANGIFYNPSTSRYYNPATGQYSNLAPLGPATMTNGSYAIPSGYSPSSNGGYYNSTTGLYYDPTNGFYSPNPPQGPVSGTPVYTNGSTGTISYPGGSLMPNLGGSVVTYYPGVPNTGAGGNAPLVLALIAASALVSIGGVAYLARVAR